VQVTGICLVRSGGLWQIPQSFRLLLRAPQDVVVLKTPSWWNLRHTLWLLGITGGVLMAVIVWVVVLGRRLQDQMAIIRQKLRSGAVLEERNRIAREIHDTLAQGYVGISVQLEVLAELLRHRKVDEAAKQLDTTRGYVREGLAEARQSIWALRSQDSGETTLPVNLRRITEQAQGHGLDSNFSVHGAYRPLSSGAEREIVRVAQEAIHNVKKHAAAKHLFVQLNYGPAEIGLEVRDDGLGFEADGASHAPPGHFGLMGMHERAAAIGGTLEVNSGPGAGTTVRLHAPAPREAE
jgi:signal transduction histidine kinase